MANMPEGLSQCLVVFQHREEQNPTDSGPMGFCARVQKAFWSYQDNDRSDPKHLPSEEKGLTLFTEHLFNQFPHLCPVAYRSHQELVRDFIAHNATVPRYGALIFNDNCTHVLLQRPTNHYGKRRLHWQVPKGKLDNDKETGLECAAREVKEEIGVDITEYLPRSHQDRDTITIDRKPRATTILFVVVGVPLDVTTHCGRNEIEEVKWHSLTEVARSKSRYTLIVTEALRKWRILMPLTLRKSNVPWKSRRVEEKFGVATRVAEKEKELSPPPGGKVVQVGHSEGNSNRLCVEDDSPSLGILEPWDGFLICD